MFYESTKPDVLTEGKWDEESCRRRIGGYDFTKASFSTDETKWLPKGAPLALDSSTGNAVLIKTAKAAAAALAEATSLKVEKGHILAVGDVINGSTISAITAGDDYDTLTVSALGAAVAEGEVVDTLGSKKVLGLNYASVKMRGQVTVTPTLQAYEIEEDTLPYPLSEAIKEGLTCRHAFKL